MEEHTDGQGSTLFDQRIKKDNREELQGEEFIHFYYGLQERSRLHNSLQVRERLNKCYWNHEEEGEKEERHRHDQPPNRKRNEWNRKIRPIHVARLWSPRCQPCPWIPGLLRLRTDSRRPSCSKRYECCWHDRLCALPSLRTLGNFLYRMVHQQKEETNSNNKFAISP